MQIYSLAIGLAFMYLLIFVQTIRAYNVIIMRACNYVEIIEKKGA